MNVNVNVHRKNGPVRKLLEESGGQAMVEAALVLPILLLLVIGIVEFGRAWNANQVLTDAAREGARISAIADPSITVDSVESLLRNALERGSLDPDAATYEIEGVDGSSGSPTRIAIQYPYQFVFLGPLLSWSDDESLATLSTAITMRNE